MQRFAFSYGVFRVLLSLLGTGPAWSHVDLGSHELLVVMGWAFRASVPRSSIRGASPHSRLVGGIGVHGRGGRWLVNGSTKGIVVIDIDPPARGRVMGFPVGVRQLGLSLADPDGFLAAVGAHTD